MRPFLMPLAVISLAALSACGGGGGGGAPASTPTTNTPTAAPTITLDSSNYVMAATEATSSALFLLDAPSVVLGVESTDANAAIQFGRNQINSLGGWLKGDAVATGVIQTQTTNCDLGGTLVTTANDADNNRDISKGDSVTLKANNCKLRDGSTTNGTVVFNVVELVGVLNSNNYTASIQLSYQGFISTTSSSSVIANGDLTLSSSANGANVGSESISASSFTANATYSGVSSNRSLSNFLGTQVTSPNSPTSVFKTSSTVKGTVTSSSVGNAGLNIETITPFVRLNTNTYASSGQLVVTGSGGGKARVTAKNATEVLIELDANADGTYEASTTKAWSTIR